MTIRKRILIIVICFAVVPILIITSWGLLTSLRIIEELHMDRMDSLANISSSAFKEILNLHKEDLILLSTRQNVERYINISAKTENYTETQLTIERDAMTAHLKSYLALVNSFEDIILIDKDGNVDVSVHPGLVGLDVLEYDYFTQAIASSDENHVFVSKVHSSLRYPEDPGRNCVALSKLMRSNSGKVTGVMVAFVNVDVMAQFIKEIQFGQTGIAFLIDAENFILYHPEARFYNSYTTAPNLKNLFTRYKTGEIPDSGLIYDDMGGLRRIYYYEVIEDEEMVLFLRQDYNEFSKHRNHILIFAAFVLSATSLLAIYLAFKFSKSFVQPILTLKDAFVSARDEGRYAVCNIDSSDELGDMAEGYNTMIQTLERQFEEINDEKTKNEYIAYHDSITGLFNRNAFEKKLSGLLSSGEPFGVIFLDIDGFKQINDVLGHALGDALLNMLGQRIKNSQPEFDICARIGGDEFLMAKTGGRAQLEVCAKNLIRDLRVPFEIEMNTLHITCSIGVAMYPDDGDDAQSLIKNADISMYSAKDGGKNAYKFYNMEMQKRIERYSSIMSVLRECIEKDEVYLEYQPEIDAKTGKTVVYEALMRINSEKLGRISPAEFIPVAESDNRIINKLGHWALRSVCAFTRRLIDEHGFDGLVAVNISARQLHRDNFVGEVMDVLQEFDLPPKFLIIELTESILMSDIKNNAEKLSQLREKGLTVAMDDFGTHYSSFNYLVHLPLDVLKIDRSFFTEIETNKRVFDINRMIIDIAHNLDLKVVAEGAETQGQVELIKEIGCDIIQGYYFSRPLPVDEVIKWNDTSK